MPRTAETPKPTLDSVEIALAAIYAALNVNGSWAWEDWAKYAASGEWA